MNEHLNVSQTPIILSFGKFCLKIEAHDRWMPTQQRLASEKYDTFPLLFRWSHRGWLIPSTLI